MLCIFRAFPGINSLTDQLGFLGWEKHVGVVWVNGGREVLIAVGHDGASCPKLPSVDLERRNIRVGADGGGLPGDVTFIGSRVGSEPVEGASVVRSLGTGGFESKAESEGWSSGQTAETSADDAHVQATSGSTRSQAKQARGLTTVQLRGLGGHNDWEKIAVG